MKQKGQDALRGMEKTLSLRQKINQGHSFTFQWIRALIPPKAKAL